MTHEELVWMDGRWSWWMAANHIPPAPQPAQDGAEAGGGCVDSLEARNGLEKALRVTVTYRGRTADVTRWFRQFGDALHQRGLESVADRYRAALARGVWWG